MGHANTMPKQTCERTSLELRTLTVRPGLQDRIIEGSSDGADLELRSHEAASSHAGDVVVSVGVCVLACTAPSPSSSHPATIPSEGGMQGQKAQGMMGMAIEAPPLP